jgi:hypothetical protein
MDLSSYVPTDGYFGVPFFDTDEQRDEPVPHRYLHGGFGGTDTRFAIYLPPREIWRGRFFQPFGGGQGGDEFAHGPASMIGQVLGGLVQVAELGGYMIESNQGHIQSAPDPSADDPATLYGYRASAEAARFGKFVAAAHYGEAPDHGYVFGGGGGSSRALQCLEQAPGIWDGAFPFITAGKVDPEAETTVSYSPVIANFSAMLNVRRALGPKLASFLDAVEPGGTGDPFEGLTTHEREAVTDLYALGFPGGEVHLGIQIGPTAVWATSADGFLDQDPGYFEAFWSTVGYAGADSPALYTDAVIQTRATVGATVTVDDLRADLAAGGPSVFSPLARFWTVVYPGPLPVGLTLVGFGGGDLVGARITITSGKAAGRRLYCRDVSGDVVLLDAGGDAGLLRLTDVAPGDEVEIDNRDFLAFCHWYRHHVLPGELGFERFIMRDRPIYPQRPLDASGGRLGIPLTARFSGRVLSMQFTPDTMIWPDQSVSYADAVQALGDDASARFCLRWIENAENAPPQFLPQTHPALNTRIIDFSGAVKQGLVDLVAWVEDGVVPAGTAYRFEKGTLTLPATAAERGGIQPVVSASANHLVRADVRIGEPVHLELTAEVPSGAGTIVKAEWDFDGTGAFPFAHAEVDGSATWLTLGTSHVFGEAGTYFPCARVSSHREGDVDDATRQIVNLARVRVVVT